MTSELKACPECKRQSELEVISSYFTEKITCNHCRKCFINEIEDPHVKALVDLLKELHEYVWASAPHLLNEDSDGNVDLDMRVVETIAQYEKQT